MTIESVTYLDDLNPSYPAEGEVATLHEGNNHIRNIKKALKNTFPGLTGPVTIPDNTDFSDLVYKTPTAEQVIVNPGASTRSITLQTAAGSSVGTLRMKDSSGNTLFTTLKNGSIQVYRNSTYTEANISLYSDYPTSQNAVLMVGHTTGGASLWVARTAATGGTNPPIYYTYNGNTVFKVSNTGGVYGTGSYTDLSDASTKENVKECHYGLDAIMQLKPSIFNFIDAPATQVMGFIAQDVEGVMPEAVVSFEDGLLGLQYSQLIAPLVKAVQQLASRVAELEGRMGD